MPKLSSKAIQEIKDFGLDGNIDYIDAMNKYLDLYDVRPPANTTSNKNMLKALRMMKSMNTADDWARLHITEAFLRR
jgi:hypothetical protein